MPRPTQRLKPSPPQPLKQSITQRRQKPLQRRPLSPQQPRAGEAQLPACGARPLPGRLLRSLRRPPFPPRQRQRLLLWMQRPSCASTNRCGTLTVNVSVPMTWVIAEHIIRPKVVDDGLFRTSRYARSMSTVVATLKRESSVGLESFGLVSHTRRMLPAAVERRMKRRTPPYGGHRRPGGMPW